jgi:hypothetical protein
MSLVGERRAIASTILIFFTFLFGGVAFLAPPELTRAYIALAACYGVGFFALVAGYFWARWYGIGVGLFGCMLAGMGIWQVGPEEILLFFGGAHLAAVLALMGEAMQAPFEGQPQWRARFHMDDHAVNRLGRSVIRASLGLPMVLMYALLPKPGNAVIVGFAAVLASAGLAGLVRMRSWGVFALGASAATALVAVALGSLAAIPAAAILTAAAAPFAGPVLRALRQP